MTRLTLAFTDLVGPADGPLLVLGPSLGTSTVLWSTTVPLLARRFRVTAWDLPGHGRSPHADGAFAIGDLADAVAAGAAERGGERMLYAGVSLGGAVGVELALRHPGLVEAAAIIASGAKIGEPAAWRERAALVRFATTAALVEGSVQRWFAPGSMRRHPELSAQLLDALRGADDESYALCCEALAGYDARDRLGEIEVPILAAWGEHDIVAPYSMAVELAEGVLDGRTAEMPDAAHLPPAEQPEATASLLHEFFRADRP